MKNKYDVVIIGSGIIGSLTARYLSRYNLSVLVVEKEIDVGMCPSSANSAIIHAGYDPKPGTMKAEMNAKGNRIWHSLAPELGIVFEKTGSLVVATSEDDVSKLKQLQEQAAANNIPGVEILDKEQLKTREPLINPEAVAALWAPTAAVLDPFGAVLAAAENAVANGVTYLFETEFTDFIIDSGRITGIRTTKGDFICRRVINAAGLYADEVTRKAGARIDFSITPRKGSYLIFDPMKITLKNVIFPVPSEMGKGILASTTTHGNVLIGPNNEACDGKNDTATGEDGLMEVFNGAKRLIPSLDLKNVIAQYCGVRAKGNGTGDFIVEKASEVQGLINLLGIESPGFASAPAIALRVIELLKESGEKLEEKPDWNPVRKPFPHFHRMSNVERKKLIAKNPAYGRIVCRCEEITEGEILDAIHSPVPARTYDGIKRRTWMGTGRCQGAFDYPRVIAILSRELGIPAEEVTKKGKGSELVYRGTKECAQ
ncbi:MAG: NAD(P)/FAD-dependent oxidoreductase [Spirochaetia bacterium]|nr:NAD(P)/FAD-dependent oxidoreductase [Spirochaetia bacterium]